MADLTESEQAALFVNPWDGGKGDDDYIVLRNSIVVTRRLARCAVCFESIPVGSRVRAQTECGAGKVMTFRFCPTCVEAFAAYRLKDDWKALDRRYNLGRKNALEGVPRG